MNEVKKNMKTGEKLMWTGVTAIAVTMNGVWTIPAGVIVGAVLLFIGCVMNWFDK